MNSSGLCLDDRGGLLLTLSERNAANQVTVHEPNIARYTWDSSRMLEPLFPGGEACINMDETSQGFFGDCYIIAALNSIVCSDLGRKHIYNIMYDNYDGTVTVKLALPEHRGHNFTSEQNWACNTVLIKVSKNFIKRNFIATPARLQPRAQGPLWVLVLEKAIICLLMGDNYLGASGGHPATVYSMIFKMVTHYEFINKNTEVETLMGKISAGFRRGIPMSCGTNHGQYIGTGIQGAHAYAVTGYSYMDSGAIRDPEQQHDPCLMQIISSGASAVFISNPHGIRGRVPTYKCTTGTNNTSKLKLSGSRFGRTFAFLVKDFVRYFGQLYIASDNSYAMDPPGTYETTLSTSRQMPADMAVPFIGSMTPTSREETIKRAVMIDTAALIALSSRRSGPITFGQLILQDHMKKVVKHLRKRNIKGVL